MKTMPDWNYLVEEENAYVGAAFGVQGVFDPHQEFPRDYYRYLEHIQRIVTEYKPDFRYFLDVGAGGGAMVRLLKERYAGRDIRGLDPVYRGEDVAGGDIYTTLPEEQRADVVLLKEVVQHISRLENALASAVCMLNPGGILIIIDRNPVSFLGLLKRPLEWYGKWMYPRDTPFRERWYFRHEWRNILARLGTIVYFETVNSTVSRPVFFGLENRFFIMAIRVD